MSFFDRTTPTVPDIICQISALLKWYCQESLTLGLTTKILGLSFPEISSVFIFIPLKKYLQNFEIEIHQ
jgi:hypothetical protein